MNTINPQVTPQGVPRNDARGGERTDAISIPSSTGKDLPSEAAINDLQGQDVAASKDAQANQQLPRAVAKLNEYIQTVQRDLMFSLDESSGEAVISVVDRQSLKVVRQIPSEIALTLAQKLSNEEPLSLFSAQV
jgi:flagellar protein FlaG